MEAAHLRTTAPSADEDPTTTLVVRIARDLAVELHPGMPGIEQLGPDSSIAREFGLDSLALVELAARVEQAFAATLPEDEIAAAETPRDLARALARIQSAAPATRPVPAWVKEPGPRAPTPDSISTLLEALEWHTAEQPDKTHILLIDREADPQRITFSELRKEVSAVAAGLIKRGIARHEPVAIMLPTCREFFAAFYGALYAQAVPVPLYPPARPSQIESHLRRVAGILANCEAKVLLTFERARRVGHLLRSLDTCLTTIATLEEIKENNAPYSAPSISATDIAFLQYTSGSTGQPKGVVLTHANVLANLHAMQRATGISHADCFVSWLPLYHDMGLIGACFGALLVGFPLVLMSPFTFLTHPTRWLRAIHTHRATVTAAPNFAYEICLNKISDAQLTGLDLSSLRVAFNGAEAVSAQTVERFARRFAAYGLKPATVLPVYGLAECALGLTFPPISRVPLIDSIDRGTFLRSGVARPVDADDSAPLRIVSCGKPLPRHSVRIIDTDGTVLAERSQGRIQFQGPSATSGYYRNPAETARLFDGRWLDTGDLGYLARGELYVSGRAKDIIIRGGHNIHPQELEEAVGQVQGVRKGGVVAFPATDRRSGTERIVVLAETRETSEATRDEIVSRINRLAVDLIGLPVDDVVLVPPRTVLKTSSGKIRRAACRDTYERGELGKSSRSPWVQIARLRYQALITQSTHSMRRLGQTLWGLRALIVASCLAPLVWCTVVLAPSVHRRREVGAVMVRAGLRLCGVPLRIAGFSQSERRLRVFVANHASYMDSLVLIVALPPDATFVAKKELAGFPAIGLLLKRLGCVFVERDEVREATTGARELQARLAEGESLALFAEGTFQRDPGLLPFHMGAFFAAATASVPVVPVAIRGTRAMLPDGIVLPRPATIEVILGEPLVPADKSWHAAVELRAWARAHILSHINEPDLD